MKVLLVNTSPHKQGTTWAALNEAAAALEACGAETEIFWAGERQVNSCIACQQCKKQRINYCAAFQEDAVNAVLKKMEECDGMIVGSPVHFAGLCGTACALMDRIGYAGGKTLRFKPAAGVAVCRRAGTTSALDQFNKYFTYCCMPVVSSIYWNGVFGNTAEQAAQDEEGMQVMRQLGRNMAWLIKSIEAGKAAGVEAPEFEKGKFTNYIR